jgi:hypothetical protein
MHSANFTVQDARCLQFDDPCSPHQQRLLRGQEQIARMSCKLQESPRKVHDRPANCNLFAGE